MKIAIHKEKYGFSSDWTEYCQKNGVDYKLVNCYASNIIKQLNDYDVLLWHHHHTLVKDAIFAKQLLYSLEHSGKKVFPDFRTGWHFDDKLGQKYLLEAINAPYAKTWVFYEKKDAIRWATESNFPKVFKLRGGAGSTNVRLIKTRRQAIRIIKRAFGRGISTYNKIGDLKEQMRKFNGSYNSFLDFLKSIRRLLLATKFSRAMGRQKNYVLFQEFMDGNIFDIRVVVIGKRAFAIKRMVRKNDFRASGSGLIKYEKEDIDERCVQIAFDVNNKIKSQCIAYDFVFDKENKPVIVEINYGFDHKAYFKCPGYWDNELNWHKGKFNSADWIIEELISKK